MGGIAILATAPDTVVTVRPGSTRLAADPGGQVVPDAEGLIQLTLQPHEVLTLNGRNGPYPVTERDLSGAVVESSEPVAVFASHQCARVPGSLGACDHLEEQLFPTDAWGRRFVLTPLATRGRRGCASHGGELLAPGRRSRDAHHAGAAPTPSWRPWGRPMWAATTARRRSPGPPS
ncbi:MAG: IgGFc-binding protein [bacterium]